MNGCFLFGLNIWWEGGGAYFVWKEYFSVNATDQSN